MFFFNNKNLLKIIFHWKICFIHQQSCYQVLRIVNVFIFLDSDEFSWVIEIKKIMSIFFSLYNNLKKERRKLLGNFQIIIILKLYLLTINNVIEFKIFSISCSFLFLPLFIIFICFCFITLLFCQLSKATRRKFFLKN